MTNHSRGDVAGTANVDLLTAVDMIVERAMKIAEEIGADRGLILDRMLTQACAQIAAVDGVEKTAVILEKLARNVRLGALDPIAAPDGSKPKVKH